MIRSTLPFCLSVSVCPFDPLDMFRQMSFQALSNKYKHRQVFIKGNTKGAWRWIESAPVSVIYLNAGIRSQEAQKVFSPAPLLSSLPFSPIVLVLSLLFLTVLPADGAFHFLQIRLWHGWRWGKGKQSGLGSDRTGPDRTAQKHHQQPVTNQHNNTLPFVSFPFPSFLLRHAFLLLLVLHSLGFASAQVHFVLSSRPRVLVPSKSGESVPHHTRSLPHLSSGKPSPVGYHSAKRKKRKKFFFWRKFKFQNLNIKIWRRRIELNPPLQGLETLKLVPTLYGDVNRGIPHPKFGSNLISRSP